ncbi:hypothetical protein L7F22_055103 [Adiantum nelumboides]|nr:hypothetical protein [Adiantum nelumboides]
MSAADEELPDLQKKVVLVTGASSGLGRDFCVALARRGCCIIAAARRTDRLLTLLNDITPLQPPLQHVLLPLDVSAGEVEIDAAVEKAWQTFGRIDVLINNAGFRGMEENAEILYIPGVSITSVSAYSPILCIFEADM